MDVLDLNKDLRQLLLESQQSVDSFLITNYRYDSIDMLLQDLALLNQQLSQELIQLINQNFKQFIDLSSNLKDSEHLIQMINVNLLGFNNLVTRIITKFSHIQHQIEFLMDITKSLQYYKFKINTILLVNALIRNLEALLGQQEASREVGALHLTHFKLIINLILNINNLIHIVNHPVVNSVKFKALIREVSSHILAGSADGSTKFELFKMLKILKSIE